MMRSFHSFHLGVETRLMRMVTAVFSRRFKTGAYGFIDRIDVKENGGLQFVLEYPATQAPCVLALINRKQLSPTAKSSKS